MQAASSITAKRASAGRALTSQMTYERLLPAASRSPLVRDRGNANQVGAGLILSYHF